MGAGSELLLRHLPCWEERVLQTPRRRRRRRLCNYFAKAQASSATTRKSRKFAPTPTSGIEAESRPLPCCKPTPHYSPQESEQEPKNLRDSSPPKEQGLH